MAARLRSGPRQRVDRRRSGPGPGRHQSKAGLACFGGPGGFSARVVHLHTARCLAVTGALLIGNHLDGLEVQIAGRGSMRVISLASLARCQYPATSGMTGEVAQPPMKTRGVCAVLGETCSEIRDRRDMLTPKPQAGTRSTTLLKRSGRPLTRASQLVRSRIMSPLLQSTQVQ